MAHDVFVVGLDDDNLAMLERLPEAHRYRFHDLVHYDELRGVAEFDMARLIDLAEARLRASGRAVAAIVTLLDFPATELVPLLARRHGVRAPTLEAVLRCSHKYWSRLLQREVVPETVPRFAVFDPTTDRAVEDIGLGFPLWVKPLNAYRSHLGFRVGSPDRLGEVLPVLREELPKLAEPLALVLREADVPEEIAGLGPSVCIAEELIGGRQCTVEGYVHGGVARAYGIVDSIRDRNRTSFARYQYPSTLPRRVQTRLVEASTRVLEHVGFDDGCFNVEFFWDRRRDHIWLLEVNPRLSQSQCELFERVDGVSSAQVMLDVALGKAPDLPRRRGEAAVAATCFVRAHHDGVVARAPTSAEVAAVEARVPGASVTVHVEDGTVLGELADQDSYSYELATVRLGARSEHELLRRYDDVRAALPFEIEPRGDC